MWPELSRRQALVALSIITLAGGLLRFYNLAWGALYYHFHIDEHFVFSSADMLRRNPQEAAESSKFFMYGPFLPYLINIGRAIYETLSHPLNLAVPRDEITYMVIGRGISAAFGTATILLVYAVASRVATRTAGLLAAFFLAFSVLHIRDAHFAATDVAMTCLCVVVLYLSILVVEKGEIKALAAAGLALGIAVVTKYTGAFTLGVIGLAYFMSPRRPTTVQPVSAWMRWVLIGLIPIIVAVVTFLVLDPLAWEYSKKFKADIKVWVQDPLTGATKPIWAAQFADLGVPEFYWFTNLLWWSVGPALECLAIAGLIWVIAQWNKRMAVIAAFPILYFLTAGRTIAPFVRYALPLMPATAILAGLVAAAWLARPRLRAIAMVGVGVAALSTVGYAVAYMNVFRQPDSRLQASRWLQDHVPAGATILTEPSQNFPPTGSYLNATDFNRDYVLWGRVRDRVNVIGNPQEEREWQDFYHFYTLDAYDLLYRDGVSNDDKKRYIAARLATSDWIVTDDTFLQFYQHLPDAKHRVVKAFYRDLLAGRLGFKLEQTFKVYPSLFGIDINDDGAELTFRLFDHPRVFIFKRTTP